MNYYDNCSQADIAIEREKNNRILASCIKAKGIAMEATDEIIRFTSVLQTWQDLAIIAKRFEELDNDERKRILKNQLSTDAYGKAVADAYSYFSQNMSGPSVNREFLHLYSAVSRVANSKIPGAPQIPGIAAALCELLEFENEQPDIPALYVYICPNGEYESGIYCYSVEEYTLTFLRKVR